MKATEHQTQAAIVAALRLAGFTVRETTAFRQKGPSGVDKGIPDHLVCHRQIPLLYLPLEVKRSGCEREYSSLEQRLAHESGEFMIVSSVEDALKAAKRFLEQYAAHAHSALAKASGVLRATTIRDANLAGRQPWQ